MNSKDTIYALPLEHVGKFQFDEQVVNCFPDMIARSVPGYASILSMIGELSEAYAKPGSNIYDLGCSLGAATMAMRNRVPCTTRLIAVDTSQAMIDALKTKLAAQAVEGCPIEVSVGDIRDLVVTSASFSVLNFTLQFVPQQERHELLTKIAEGTISGGALVLSEKICYSNPEQQKLMTELHHNFKRANGYSELEIAQKRTALEDTLVAETLESHLERLKSVGFSNVACWFQCFNFVSILAVK